MENGTNKQFTFVLSVKLSGDGAAKMREAEHATKIDKVNRAELGPF